jgi:uncharacterized membrane protein
MNRTTAFWVVTGLFCLAFTMGGTMHLLRAEQMAEGMRTLGYPAYVMTILGTAKLLGVVALLVPGRLILKEWAYAGFTIDLVGASVSHIFVSDPVFPTILPILVLTVGLTSYFARPSSRRITSP